MLVKCLWSRKELHECIERLYRHLTNKMYSIAELQGHLDEFQDRDGLMQ